MQTNYDLVTLGKFDSQRRECKKGTHVFKEGEKCKRPNNGADASNDIVLRGYGTICGPNSIEDIQR